MRKKKQVYLRMSEEMHAAAKAAAESVDLSTNAWIIMRVAQGIRNWEDPLTGKRASPEQKVAHPLDGIICNHPGHGGMVKAAECQRPEAHQKQEMWVSAATGEVWMQHTV